MKRHIAFIIAPLVSLAVACSLGHKDGTAAVGRVQAKITAVPESIYCVQILAAAGRTVDQSFDVTPGASVTVTMNAIPVGNVTFTAFAYNQSCSAIGGAQPTWASPPTVSTIFPGQVSGVELTLEPVGGANVGVNFQDAGMNDMGYPVDLGPDGGDMATADMSPLPAAHLRSDWDTFYFHGLQSQQITIYNDGNTLASTNSYTLTGDGFAVDYTNCSIVWPQSSCVLTVKTVAADPVGRTGSLVISYGPSQALSLSLVTY